MTSVPSGAVRVSVVGSKSSRPDSARAMTVSGDVTKLSVFAEPSLRLGKLRFLEPEILREQILNYEIFSFRRADSKQFHQTWVMPRCYLTA